MSEYGLTSQQVREAEARGEINILPDNTQKTVKDIIKENVFTYFNFIFAVLTLLVVIAGAYRSLTMLGAVIFNAMIGIVQQLRAKKILDNLSILSQVAIQVVRDGQISEVPTDRLVKGDVVIFHSGSQICADARVLTGEVSVNESLLTGESDEIPKKPGDSLLSGSFVVTGECQARLTHVGEDSYVARLEAEARQMDGQEQSEMVRGINRFVLLAGIAIVPIGILLFIQGHLQGNPFTENVTSMVAAVVGMIPEGLYVLVSMTLAVSAAGLARKKIMLHDMKSIEALARADVLCVDKTGTITENDMVVEDVVLLSKLQGAGLSGPGAGLGGPTSASGAGQTSAAGTSQTFSAGAGQTSALGAGLGGSTSAAGAGLGGPGLTMEQAESLMASYLQAQKDDNATMKALRERFQSGSFEEDSQKGISGKKGLRKKGSGKTGNGEHWDKGDVGSPGTEQKRALRVLPFSSKYKYSAVAFPDGNYVLGAPDILLRNSQDIYKEEAEKYYREGMRVLVFAQTGPEVFEAGSAEIWIRPILFVLLKNPIRAGAEDTFEYFNRQGVTVKVISGDHPLTVSRIAGQAGIPDAHKAIDASILKDQEELEAAVEEYTVFARVTPDRKRQIICALQDKGHTVAMTGDGVNDIMAMKVADCSVAMASGSEAAVQAAQVVLMDSDFSRMPKIVAEGRRVIGNIERSATLFLTKNIFSMLLALFSIINVMAYPLQPEQVSLISGFNIGIPAFLLAMEPNERRIRGHFMTRVFLKALPAAITDFTLIAALMVLGVTFHVPQSDIAVAATFLLGIVGFMILYYICRPLSKYRIFVIILCLIGFAVSACVFHTWFGITFISRRCMMLFIPFAVAAEPCMRYLTKLADLIENKLESL